MILSDNVNKSEGLGSFFKNLRKVSTKAGEKLATNVLKKPGSASDITANIASAAASRDPEAVLSKLPEAINFYHTGKGLYLGRFV